MVAATHQRVCFGGYAFQDGGRVPRDGTHQEWIKPGRVELVGDSTDDRYAFGGTRRRSHTCRESLGNRFVEPGGRAREIEPLEGRKRPEDENGFWSVRQRVMMNDDGMVGHSRLVGFGVHGIGMHSDAGKELMKEP